ncbi:hypothetical protein ANN_17560 [Periplaneta americana]|uniref:Uncharacterized protein n=1 Tax=Periplaneta americana TaxID=6978 RepID=A0ABQ8SUL0_PERAM|nr:hypothetical protein ANN_17560 [Periplaneta americana]
MDNNDVTLQRNRNKTAGRIDGCHGDSLMAPVRHRWSISEAIGEIRKTVMPSDCSALRFGIRSVKNGMWPDLEPSDYHLLGSLKEQLRGQPYVNVFGSWNGLLPQGNFRTYRTATSADSFPVTNDSKHEFKSEIKLPEDNYYHELYPARHAYSSKIEKMNRLIGETDKKESSTPNIIPCHLEMKDICSFSTTLTSCLASTAVYKTFLLPDLPDPTAPSLSVTNEDVLNSLQSFPQGFAAGIDGLRPQHLKDLVSVSAVACLNTRETTSDCIRFVKTPTYDPSKKKRTVNRKIDVRAKCLTLPTKPPADISPQKSTKSSQGKSSTSRASSNDENWVMYLRQTARFDAGAASSSVSYELLLYLLILNSAICFRQL